MGEQFARIWSNAGANEGRVQRALSILNRYRANAARAGYLVRDARGATNVQIPRRVYMGLSNG